MSPRPNSRPVVRHLGHRSDVRFCMEQAFDRLCAMPGCLWLDSASQLSDAESSAGESIDDAAAQVGRYSFLTADPVCQLVAGSDDPNPWPQLDLWQRNLPSQCDPTLPPFQGGIAGMIGYESGAWLEKVGVAAYNDLPTAAMSIGLYDWTVALDHHSGDAWIISQGITGDDGYVSTEFATQRADQFETLLRDCLVRRSEIAVGDVRKEIAELDRSNVISNFSSQQFRAAVGEIVRRIRDGDSFQVNLAQRLLRKANLASPELYRRLRRANPAPFGGYYNGGDFAVLSSSPEGFLTVRDRVVQTRPIKGTIVRTGDAVRDAELADQLLCSAKDRAENVMIVDLMRNDLSRVCTDESVRVRKLCEIERYQYVQHLVSVVEGHLRDDQTVVDLLRACFPGGSVTGAPKIEAMRTIAELEPNPRGPYCGSLGYISCGGAADFNILIRTITSVDGFWQIPVGGGITAQSDPIAEEAETWAKAEGMLRAMQ
ncbi:MAG: anthranilate synthase component I family protein [Pirellulaceae bacterium]|nr:anthranilate synthase component I family protein [Pirellulaceae bacterium]